MKDLVSIFVEQMDSRLVRIEQKLDGLLAFKWQVLGGSLVVSGLIAVAVQVFFLR